MKIEKLLNDIPGSLTPDTIMLVKKDSVVKSYITDNLGNIAHEINSFQLNVKGPLNIERNTSVLPSTFPEGYTPLSVMDYTITDYDCDRLYNIIPISGLVKMEGENIYYIAPTTVGVSGFIINGKTFNINITEIELAKPIITSPLTGAVDINSGIHATCTPFTDLATGDAYESSDWQISELLDFSVITTEVVASTFSEIDWFASGLIENTTYYLRTRQKGVTVGYSLWSDPISFTTAAVFVNMELSRTMSLFSAANDSFGMNVRMSRDGTKAFVMSLDSGNTLLTIPGIVYVYNVVGNFLEYENSIQAINAASEDYFGRSISVSDDINTLAISAPTADRNGHNDAGSVYVYIRNGINWDLQQEIISPTPGLNYGFGTSVSISGDGNTLVVGEPFGPGNAFVYTRTNSVWSLSATINASTNIDSGYRYGYYVDITADGTRVVVGNYFGPGDCNAVFVNNAGVWTEEAILGTSSQFGNGFCCVINDAGDIIVIGSCYENSLNIGASLSGAIYIYERVGSTWTLNARLESDNPGTSEYFGSNIAINLTGNKIIVGCRNDEVNGITRAGATYVFEKSGGVWSQVDKIVPSNIVLNGSFGFSLDMTPDGTLAIIGSNDDTNNISKGGSVYLFSL